MFRYCIRQATMFFIFKKYRYCIVPFADVEQVKSLDIGITGVCVESSHLCFDCYRILALNYDTGTGGVIGDKKRIGINVHKNSFLYSTGIPMIY